MRNEGNDDRKNVGEGGTGDNGGDKENDDKGREGKRREIERMIIKMERERERKGT